MCVCETNTHTHSATPTVNHQVAAVWRAISVAKEEEGSERACASGQSVNRSERQCLGVRVVRLPGAPHVAAAATAEVRRAAEPPRFRLTALLW